MVILTITGFFGFNISGFSIFIGIIAFFVFSDKKNKESELDFKSIKIQLSDKKIWFWIFLPMIANFFSMGAACFLLPGFINHVKERVGQILTFDKMLLLSVQLIITAVGEEIAWRAFFQKRLGEHIPMQLSIVLTSIFFASGHFSSGLVLIVTYDLLFVFINSLFYGIVFKKTNNAWVSAVSHLVANVSGIVLLFIVG